MLRTQSPLDALGADLRSLLRPHIGDLKYKEMVQATRQAFYDITEDLRDHGMTWAQVTELTGAPRTTITSIPFEVARPIAFKNRFMTELRRRPEMKMSRSEAAILYHKMCDEEDALTEPGEDVRRAGLDTFLKALRSMGLIETLKDRRRSIQATASGDSSVSERPERSVMSSIKAYASRVVDIVVSRSTRRSARMYRTQFDIAQEDMAEFLDAWKAQTIELVRAYEARAHARGGGEQFAIVYGGATVEEIHQTPAGGES